MASPPPAEVAPARRADGPRPFRVTTTRQETEDTWTLALEPAGGEPPPAFRPGQFNMLYAFGVGEIPISISGDPGVGGPLVHTVRAVGPVSAAICAGTPRRTAGGARALRDGLAARDAANGHHVVIVAGGIGLAPLRPALLEALSGRDRLESLVLLYGGRTPGQLLYRCSLRTGRPIRGSRSESRSTAPRSAGSGNVGVVTKLIDRAAFDPTRSVAFSCGPEVMMRFAVEALLRRGSWTRETSTFRSSAT